MYSRKGIATHIWRSHGEGKNHDPNIGYKFGSREIWNKGLTKETNTRVREISETLSNNLKTGITPNSFQGKEHTEKVKRVLSEKLSKNNKGGRCKWFTFAKATGETVKVQGTWELRFAKVLEVIDPEWIKVGTNSGNHSFEWVDSRGKYHTYTPDFWSPKLNKYFEVKGYWWGEDEEKMRQVLQSTSIAIEIVFEKQLEDYERKMRQ